MLNQEELRRVLAYNKVTGDFTWLVNVPYTPIAVGDVAGFVDGQYLRQGINGKYYRLHKLAFLWVEGYMPEEVDHINHNGYDNRWVNLRDVSHKENSKNQKKHSTNTSGTTGVYLTDPQWIARITVDGKTINLGTFKKKAEAIAARKAAEILHGFHINHGRNYDTT